MSIYYTENSEKIQLTHEIGRGGEGPVYAIQGSPLECAKIYSKNLSHEDHKKLIVMAKNPPSDPAYDSRKHRSIAWPSAILYADSKKTQFAGFVMPKIDGKIFKKALNYLDPSDRRKLFGGGFTWQYLFTAAFNIASAVAAIHERGYCIGDVNESNILIAENALITLIDCDSFHVRDNSSGTTYRCLVGKPEYTAPELQGISYKDVDRTFETDCFALGVIIFQLLMEGTHPYQAKGPLVKDAPSTHEKIIKGYFPYTSKLSGIAPPEYAPPFEILHPELRQLFHKCFADGHKNPQIRPSAKEWFTTLKQIGNNFRKCTKNENHLYLGHISNCPWCLLVSKTGQDPFPSPIGQQIALNDPSQSLDSLDKRIAYLKTYIDMALSDGVLTGDEKDYILDMGSKLQVPKKEIEKILTDEIKKCSAKTGVLSGQGTPKLEISKTSFDFTNIRTGSAVSESFTISNTGGGILSGTIKTNKKWLKVSQSSIDTARHKQDITFYVDTSGLPFGLNDIGIIEIPSNGGTGKIAVNLSVEVPEKALSRFRWQFIPALAVIAASLSYISGIEGSFVPMLFIISLGTGFVLSKPLFRYQSISGKNLITPLWVTAGVLLFVTIIAANHKSPSQESSRVQFSVTAPKDVNAKVRTNPSGSADSLGVLKIRKGETLGILEAKGDWYKIKVIVNGKDKVGWIHKSLVSDKGQKKAETNAGTASDSNIQPNATVNRASSDISTPPTPKSWTIAGAQLFTSAGEPLHQEIAKLIAALESRSGEGTPVSRQEFMDMLPKPEAQTIYYDEIMKYGTPVSLAIQKKEHKDYTEIFMREHYQKAGVEFLRTQREYLEQAERDYGVLQRDIVSVLIWESGLGKFTGDYRVFNVFLGQMLFLDQAQEIAVQNLIAEGKENPLDDPAQAQKEQKRLQKLKTSAINNMAALLRVCKKAGINPFDMKGSWGGAIGNVQFMPANLKYAVDGDRDGNLNLAQWPDAIMSVGNFLKIVGKYEPTNAGRMRALLKYNPSKEFANGVMMVAETIWNRHLNGE